MKNRLSQWADNLKQELRVLYYASKDPQIPFFPKALLAIAIAYAMSPLDLIPDFIPILGYLDDLIILPLLILLAIKTIPEDVLNRAREKSANYKPEIQTSFTAAGLIVFLWITAAIVLGCIIFR